MRWIPLAPGETDWRSTLEPKSYIIHIVRVVYAVYIPVCDVQRIVSVAAQAVHEQPRHDVRHARLRGIVSLATRTPAFTSAVPIAAQAVTIVKAFRFILHVPFIHSECHICEYLKFRPPSTGLAD